MTKEEIEMTKEEFISKLPAKIQHHSYGESMLSILEETQYRKAACYQNADNFKSGVRFSNNWDNLYKEMSIYLKREGHIT